MKNWRPFIKEHYRQILILLVSCLPLLFSALVFSSEKDAFFVRREGYMQERREEIYVAGLGEEEYRLEIPVSGKEYTDDEREAVTEELLSWLTDVMAKDNPSLMEIQSKLFLPRRREGYYAAFSYEPEDFSLIDGEGNVYNEELSDERESYIDVEIRFGEHRSYYRFPVCVLPPAYSEQERLVKAFSEHIEKEDRKYIHEDGYRLPQNWNGTPLHYRREKQRDFFIFPVLGVIFVLLIPFYDRQKVIDEEKKRRQQMLMDYPQILSQLIIYIGAGLSVRSAWGQIVENASASGKKHRFAYNRMQIAHNQLQSGALETAVYKEFGHSCGIRQYMKLASLLEQNRKDGVSGLKSLLHAESQNAWEERIRQAKRLGEEAGTKLLLPLFIMLAVVMLLVITPAVLSF